MMNRPTESLPIENIEKTLKEFRDYKYALDESAIVAITDQKGIIIHVNENFCKISKYSAEELLGSDHRIINSGFHSKEFIKNIWITIANGKIWRGELRNRAKDGTIYWVDTTIVPFLDEHNKPYQYVAIRADITARKLAEETIKNSLREKEVLIRELYHRTKNNMQVISSLLGLRASASDDPHLNGILEDMRNRIQSIALVHEKLYQTKNLSTVDLKEYIADLVKLLVGSFSPDEHRVSLILEVESIEMELDLAVPCGLVVNELVSNSLKYAFPDDKSGFIKVVMRKLDKELLELVISDNGVGIPEGVDLMSGNTLGVQLLHNIVASQLNGEMKINTQNGLGYTITFKNFRRYEVLK